MDTIGNVVNALHQTQEYIHPYATKMNAKHPCAPNVQCLHCTQCFSPLVDLDDR